MTDLLSHLFPLIYGGFFLLLLWQAFRVMARGFSAVPRVDDPLPNQRSDRTGRLTIHPELLDSEGQLTRDDLLTVRFGADQDPPLNPSDPQ
jgi:hypothetical protein